LLGLETSVLDLLAHRVSVEKSAVSPIGLLLTVTWCFSLADFKILSLSFIFCDLTIICQGESHFCSYLFGVL
jgi:hypothetical protein